MLTKSSQTSGRSQSEQEPVTTVAADVDRVIGEGIRSRRVELGLTQTDLGSKLGLSYQQIQKYEWGTNRVSSSVLYDISCVLMVPVSYFFEPLSRQAKHDTEANEEGRARFAYLATPEGQHLVDTFRSLPQQARNGILGMMVGLSRCKEYGSRE